MGVISTIFLFLLPTMSWVSKIEVSKAACVSITSFSCFFINQTKRVVLQENSTAESDPDYMIINHNISTINEITYINAEVHVIQDIQKYFTISTLSAVKNGSNVVDFFNRTVDACKIFERKNRNDWFYRLFLDAYSKCSDIPLTCPLKKVT